MCCYLNDHLMHSFGEKFQLNCTELKKDHVASQRHSSFMQKEPTAITHFKLMLSLKQTEQGSNSEHKYHIYRTKLDCDVFVFSVK